MHLTFYKIPHKCTIYNVINYTVDTHTHRGCMISTPTPVLASLIHREATELVKYLSLCPYKRIFS